jgi:ATP-dependent Lhr-like helicase
VELSDEVQRIGISATVGNLDVIGLFPCGKRHYTIVQIPVAKTLDFIVWFAGDLFLDQMKLIEKCIDSHTSTLVFANTRTITGAIGHPLQRRE